MTQTVRMKASQLYKDWHVIDAAGRPLGRVATEAAVLLRGKHKPTYEPHLDGGDFVIVVNASQVRVTGRKAIQNKYYTHSGYPGGLKTRTFAQQAEKHPERIIEQAVWGMLPDGPLGKKILRHLKVYRGPEHPHQSQIAGTEKAQAARVESQAALATTPLKPRGLRPLSVPQVVETEAEAAPVPVAAAAPAKPARGRKAAEAPAPAEEPAAPVAEAATAEVSEAPGAEAKPARATRARAKAAEATTEAPAAEAVEAAPKPRASRAKATPAATDAETAEAPKPRARRTKAETTAEAPAAAPKPRASRAKAPAEPATEGEQKKPARRRTTTAKTEE